MHEIQLCFGPAHNTRPVVEDELSTFVVPHWRHGEQLQTVYRRTCQHSADGTPIYAPDGQAWPRNITLGWHAPIGWIVESAFDRIKTLWFIMLSGNGHVVRFKLDAFLVGTGNHHAHLDQVALRMIRANYHQQPGLMRVR